MKSKQKKKGKSEGILKLGETSNKRLKMPKKKKVNLKKKIHDENASHANEPQIDLKQKNTVKVISLRKLRSTATLKTCDVKKNSIEPNDVSLKPTLSKKKVDQDDKSLKTKKKQKLNNKKLKKIVQGGVAMANSLIEKVTSEKKMKLVKSKSLKKKKLSVISTGKFTETNRDIAEQPSLTIKKFDVDKKKKSPTKSLKKKKILKPLTKKPTKNLKDTGENSIIKELVIQNRKKLIKSKSLKNKKKAAVTSPLNLLDNLTKENHDIAEQPSLNIEKLNVVKKKKTPTKSLKKKNLKPVANEPTKNLKDTGENSFVKELAIQKRKKLVKNKSLKNKKETAVTSPLNLSDNFTEKIHDIVEQPSLNKEKLNVDKKKKKPEPVTKKPTENLKDIKENSFVEEFSIQKQRKHGKKKLSLRKRKRAAARKIAQLNLSDNLTETNQDVVEHPRLNKEKLNVIKKKEAKSVKKKKSVVIPTQNLSETFMETYFDIDEPLSLNNEKSDVDTKKMTLTKSLKLKKKEGSIIKNPEINLEDKVELNSLVEELCNQNQKNLIKDLSLTKNETIQPKKDAKVRSNSVSMNEQCDTTQKTLIKAKSLEKKKKKIAQPPQVMDDCENKSGKKALLNDPPKKKRKILTNGKSPKKIKKVTVAEDSTETNDAADVPLKKEEENQDTQPKSNKKSLKKQKKKVSVSKNSVDSLEDQNEKKLPAKKTLIQKVKKSKVKLVKMLKKVISLSSQNAQENSTVISEDTANIAEGPILNENKLNQDMNRKSLIESLKKKKVMQSELAKEDFLNMDDKDTLVMKGKCGKRKKVSKGKSFSFIKKMKLGVAEAQSTPEDEAVTKDNIEENPILNAGQGEQVGANQEDKPKREKLIQRSEARIVVSEFNVDEVQKEKVTLTELVNTLNQTSNQLVVHDQLKVAEQLKLDVPLHQHELEKHQRTVAYEKVCDDLRKWDPIVRENRLAEQTVYPLKKPQISFIGIDKVAESFVTRTAMEEEVANLLSNSENVVHQQRILTIAEKKALHAMSVQEAKERHKAIIKNRALISFRAVRDKITSKIKSKKYHRLLKKEKLKNMMKEFEELEKINPQAAYEQYLKTDVLRIRERVTLKHRSVGKWARQQKIRAKYNEESRVSLKEDHNLGKQLKEKLLDDKKLDFLRKKAVEGATVEDEPVSEPDTGYNLVEQCVRQSNLKKLFEESNFEEQTERTSKQVERTAEHVEHAEETTGHVVECPEKIAEPVKSAEKTAEPVKSAEKIAEPIKSAEKTAENAVEPSEEDDHEMHAAFDCDFVEDNVQQGVNINAPDQRKEENKVAPTTIISKSASKTTKDVPLPAQGSGSVKNDKVNSKEKKKAQIEVDVGFSTEVKFLDSMVPDDITGGDEDLDDVEDDAVNIQQAFADEGLIAEFCEEKEAAEKNSKVDGIDLFLPGWGSWGGPSIKPSEVLKKKFYINPPVDPPKKDLPSTVIFHSDKDTKASSHQVSKVPYPFSNYKQYKSHIRQPIGNTWNPQSSFQALVAPKVITKMGKIIEPIDTEDVVFEKRKNALHERQIEKFNATQKVNIF